MSSRLDGRVAVITGGAGGIGTALGRAFAAVGARPALLDLDGEAAAAAAAKINETGARAIGVACDVTDPGACEAAIARTREELGPVDVLVANAGISHRSLFTETQHEVLERVIRVNLMGSMHITRAAVADLAAREGRIVALSSVAGFAPLVGRTAYSASKHGLHGFFGSLRTELRDQGVSVTMVCPSYIATPMEKRALDGEGKPIGSGTRLVAGQLMAPDELARRIVRAAARRQRLLLPSFISWASFRLWQVWPALYERRMMRAQGAEFRAP